MLVFSLGQRNSAPGGAAAKWKVHPLSSRTFPLGWNAGGADHEKFRASAMEPSLFRQRLRPLLAACQERGAYHVSLLGSALRRPLDAVRDIDCYVVIPAMGAEAFRALSAAGGETIRRLAGEAGRPARLELRHGPFKPAPAADAALQLHLLIDDEASAAEATCALRARRAAAGLVLTGEPLDPVQPNCLSPACWISEARQEIERWRDAIAATEIVFRYWDFAADPRLASGRRRASTAWELRCLLDGAAKSSDLHYNACRLTGVALDEDLIRPLFSQIEEARPWEELPQRWQQARTHATELLDRRLRDLAHRDAEIAALTKSQVDEGAR